MPVKRKQSGLSATPAPATRGTTVLTIGHSNRPLADFLELLTAHGVKEIVDVRTVPRSRTNPQFNRETLPGELRKHGIAYCHVAGLGGLRHAKKDSVNSGWRNASFRGYADYMQSAEFQDNVEELIRRADGRTIALMCAEAVPWRCHRSLIADALLVRGISVEHIMSRTRRQPHTLTPFAKIAGLEITYPAAAPQPAKKRTAPASGKTGAAP